MRDAWSPCLTPGRSGFASPRSKSSAEPMHFPMQKLPSSYWKSINIEFTVTLNKTLKTFSLQSLQEKKKSALQVTLHSLLCRDERRSARHHCTLSPRVQEHPESPQLLGWVSHGAESDVAINPRMASRTGNWWWWGKPLLTWEFECCLWKCQCADLWKSGWASCLI